ncbi:MAG: hypothetical protein ACTSU5_19435 [Promethearchaeota archaeon]
MFKEKWQGFKYLFSDKETRFTSVLALFCMVVLVIGKYIYAWLPDDRILIGLGIVGIAAFWYIFWFLVSFNVAALLGAFKDEREKQDKSKTLWVLRSFALIVVLFSTILNITGKTGLALAVKRFNFYLLLFSFFAWAILEAYFLVRLFYEVSDFTTHRTIRLVAYVVLCVGYAVYLWIMLKSSSTQAPQSVSDLPLVHGVNENLLDIAIALVSFYFAFAGMGQHFLPEGGYETIDFNHLSFKEERGLRNSSLFVFLIAIGFQVFLRGLNFLFDRQMTLASNSGYYFLKFVTLVVLAVLTLLFVLVKKPGEIHKRKKEEKERRKREEKEKKEKEKMAKQQEKLAEKKGEEN